MDDTGIPLVHPTETKEDLDCIWERWRKLPDNDKMKSDEKSIEIFGMDNASHYDILGLLYV
jgi:hypothetical protein